MYNDDGQFQGPGVRSQVPWWKEPCPSKTTPASFLWLFGISAIKSISPFLPEKQDYSPTSANVLGTEATICSHFFGWSQSRFIECTPRKFILYIIYIYVYTFIIIHLWIQKGTFPFTISLWNSKGSLRSWLRFEFWYVSPLSKVSKDSLATKTRRRCENIFCRWWGIGGNNPNFASWMVFVGMEVWALR